MALNKNHEFEELNGIKCGIVEKNVSPGRVEFLKNLLEFNKYEVVVVPSPPPKTAVQSAAGSQQTPTLPAAEPVAAGQSAALQPPPPETFTVGVTDTTFNPINAIFGRQLKTPDGRIVTLAYWQQKEEVSRDEIPYYDQKS